MPPAPLLLATIAAYGATAWVMPALCRSQIRYGPRATNYAQRQVAGAAGLALPIGYGAGYVAASLILGPQQALTVPLLANQLIMLLVITSLALWGLLDDTAGDGGPRGWRGHWRSIAAGCPSTGVFKIVGAAMAALIAVRTTAIPLLWSVPAALVIALSANTINLLDLRPGRALKGFWLAAMLLLAGAGGFGGAAAPLLPLLAVTAAYAPWDFAERGMLGDTGTNVLGAALGLVVVWLAAGSRPLLLLAALFFLTVIQWLGERWSWSAIIGSQPTLTMLDNLGRHAPPPCREWDDPRE